MAQQAQTCTTQFRWEPKFTKFLIVAKANRVTPLLYEPIKNTYFYQEEEVKIKLADLD